MKDRSYFLLGLPALAFVWLAVVFGAEVRSETEIDITQGTVEPSPIAITDFHGVDEATLILGAEISVVIATNLQNSGLFQPIDKGAFQQKPHDLQQIPRFVDWRQINAEFLVSGLVEI